MLVEVICAPWVGKQPLSCCLLLLSLLPADALPAAFSAGELLLGGPSSEGMLVLPALTAGMFRKPTVIC